MIRYELESSDVSSVRFGISPLSELGLGLRALRNPAAFPLQRPWLDRIADVRPLLDIEVLHGLVNERLWVADFVSPRPDSPLTDFEAELAQLAGLSADRLRNDLTRVHGTVPPVFAAPHAEVLDRLHAALTTAWELCFAPDWQRMRAVLQADIAHRGRLIAQSGIGTMLGSLSKAVAFDGRHLDVRLTRPEPRLRPVQGEGVTLVPSMFVRRASVPLLDDLPPVILYPARGQGTMWSTASRSGPNPMRELTTAATSATRFPNVESASDHETPWGFPPSASLGTRPRPPR